MTLVALVVAATAAAGSSGEAFTVVGVAGYGLPVDEAQFVRGAPRERVALRFIEGEAFWLSFSLFPARTVTVIDARTPLPAVGVVRQRLGDVPVG